jgi:hypothetical protein
MESLWIKVNFPLESNVRVRSMPVVAGVKEGSPEWSHKVFD